MEKVELRAPQQKGALAEFKRCEEHITETIDKLNSYSDSFFGKEIFRDHNGSYYFEKDDQKFVISSIGNKKTASSTKTGQGYFAFSVEKSDGKVKYSSDRGGLYIISVTLENVHSTGEFQSSNLANEFIPEFFLHRFGINNIINEWCVILQEFESQYGKANEEENKYPKL